MPTRKTSKKTATKKAPAKKTARKTTAKKVAAKKSARRTAKKASPRKAARKSIARKVASTKPTLQKTEVKTAKKKPAAKKAAAKKTAAKKTAAKKPAAVKKAAVKPSKKSAKDRPKASDFVKRPSHTPAIFKPHTKRAIHILFTLDEVREVIKKRDLEEESKQSTRNNNSTPAMSASNNTVVANEPPRNSKHVAASLDDILGLSGGPGGSPAQGNIPRKFQKYHKLLIELRDQVRAELNLHSSDTLKRSQKDDAGDIAISVDAGTDNFDRDFALSLLSSEQEALNEIEAALKRIYNGTYGVCEVTGKPIDPERLEAVPFTRFSLEGQRQFESSSPRRVSRAGAFLNEASGEPITFGDDEGDN